MCGHIRVFKQLKGDMESKNYKDTLLRGIALLGLILILVLGAWGIIVLAFNAPNILSSAGQTIAGMFGGKEETEEEQEETEEEETVKVPVVSPAAPTTPAKPTTTAPKPTYTYTPAAQPVAQLYGYADLAARIVSVVPQGSRYSMQFEVSNVGTNVAASGWSFNAELPLDPTYTYYSLPQQALRPGDKIVYTLGFDMPYYSYRSDRHNNDERYDECGESHRSWDAEDWFDWYQDTWDTSSDAREDWDEDEWNEWYDDYCDDRNDNDRDYRDGVVSVTANPYGSTYELNRGNNTASQRVNVNYNYYPQYPYYLSY